MITIEEYEQLLHDLKLIAGELRKVKSIEDRADRNSHVDNIAKVLDKLHNRMAKKA